MAKEKYPRLPREEDPKLPQIGRDDEEGRAVDEVACEDFINRHVEVNDEEFEDEDDQENAKG